MNKCFFLLAITLSACQDAATPPSSRQVESSADTGGAIAVYRHLDKMDELAVELRMVSPVEPNKGKK